MLDGSYKDDQRLYMLFHVNSRMKTNFEMLYIHNCFTVGYKKFEGVLMSYVSQNNCQSFVHCL